MNATSITVRYGSLADKQRRYVSETIPAIFAQAGEIARERQFWAVGGESPQQVHEQIRALRYEGEQGPQDEVENLGSGDAGDCEDYAALMLAEYGRRGWPVRLVTTGSLEDNFEHAFVEVMDNGVWRYSDPKGSQSGKEFGGRDSRSVTRRWELVNGQIREVVSGSSGDFDGSGYDGLDETAKQFVRAQYVGGTLTWGYRPDGSREIISGKIKDLILRRAADEIPFNVSRDIWALGSRVGAFDPAQVAAQYARDGRPLTREEAALLPQFAAAAAARAQGVDDDKFVSAWMASLMPDAQVSALAQAMGVSGALSTQRAALADALTLMARASGKTVRESVSLAGFNAPPQDDENAIEQTVGSQGLFDDIGKKLKSVEDVARDKLRAVQTGIGVALQQVGRAVIKLGNKQPWFAQFVSKPLGFHLVATAVEELGDAIRDGTLASFDLKRAGYATANWFTAVGQALAVAAPYTGPWAPLFAACAATNVAIGKSMAALLDKAAARKAGPAQTTMFVDRYGRQVDAAGNLLDPTQRAIVEGLKYASPQYEYAQVDYGAGYGVLWTAFDGAGVPRFAEINGQWWPLNSAA